MLDNKTFQNCENLKKIYVEDGCEADLSNIKIQNSTKVGPLPETMVGNVRVWDLRGCKDIVIPEGVETIGNYWFWGSTAEGVTISASVKEIGTDAFCYCRNLKRVTFADGSRLEKIRSGCFCASGIERIVIPKNVKEIQDSTFRECENLKEVVFEAGSALKEISDCAFLGCTSLMNIQLPDGLEQIGAGCFSDSGLEEVVVPRNVVVIEEDAFKGDKNLKRVSF